jgi:hypothetical protein
MAKKVKCPINLYTSVHIHGDYLPLSKPLIQFMGLENAVFLSGIVEHYNRLRKKNKVEHGKCYYSGTQFEQTYGISRHIQRKALRELSVLGLVRDTGHKYIFNQRKLQISNVGCVLIAELVHRLEPETPKGFLRRAFNIIQKDEKLQRLIRHQIRLKEKGWREIEIGSNAKRYSVKAETACVKFITDFMKNVNLRLEGGANRSNP